MDGIICTHHFRLRFQQRGLNDAVVMALLRYGAARKTRAGAESLIFTKDALAEIGNDHGPDLLKLCERFRSIYLIVSEDGVLITVARSRGRTIH